MPRNLPSRACRTTSPSCSGSLDYPRRMLSVVVVVLPPSFLSLPLLSTFRPSPPHLPSHPLLPRDIPDRPWDSLKVGRRRLPGRSCESGRTPRNLPSRACRTPSPSCSDSLDYRNNMPPAADVGVWRLFGGLYRLRVLPQHWRD